MERQLALNLQQKLGISIVQIVREEYEMLLLSRLMDNSLGSSLIFRGGTALRLAYGSPRFSDDLDFSCQVDTTEKEFRAWCQQTAKAVPYLELDEALKKYFTLYAMFKVKDPALAETISIKLEISTRPAVWVKNLDYQLLSLKSQVTPITVLAQVASLERLEQEKVSIKPPRIRDIFDLWFLSQQLKKDYQMNWTGFDAKEVKRELYRLLAAPQRKLLEQWLPKE
jgi:predicted nucleotidyltransferase component of viral defense system